MTRAQRCSTTCLLLFGLGASATFATDVTFRVVDQDGILIPASHVEIVATGQLVSRDCDGILDCDPCLVWKNRGEYVRCVPHAVENLVGSGELTEEKGDELVSDAAQTDVSKKDFIPAECQ